MIIRAGLPASDRDAAATLYWQAFGQKLARVMGPDAKAMRYIIRVMRTDHVIAAHANDGTLLGVVGFKSRDGAFVDGTFHDLRAVYGWAGALWRAALLSLLERDIDNTRFLLDGLCVAPTARGQGIGSALLDAICTEARTRGYAKVRLDVIDTNPRARALYTRYGFRATNTQTIGPLSYIFGFTSSTTMVKTL
ncbi:GNAT family N-acetyltransferase [Loktanella sp. TSTF-M6]|uniref:GNAT family N-acetyltransferase n=1 Tax=Loktanella gaetbuli TaxID=2881335 RepID=A0ABS8BVZ9_9RHOB|nr:GNAT family N-acetyltransferase [Loktanella gaetbuli]MCB5199913.1 GNAT family N-acetyltransferase [Loktanella gaetbuli]